MRGRKTPASEDAIMLIDISSVCVARPNAEVACLAKLAE